MLQVYVTGCFSFKDKKHNDHITKHAVYLKLTNYSLAVTDFFLIF